jgi:hypothetical protein
MIFEMRFQILVLAATASVLASYAVAENPAAPLARSDNFAATNGVSEGAVAISRIRQRNGMGRQETGR